MKQNDIRLNLQSPQPGDSLVQPLKQLYIGRTKIIAPRFSGEGGKALAIARCRDTTWEICTSGSC